ncbi:molybdopterin-dependent oxidoreductase [Nocardioides sambongensis]|uniref:molybdopterin-dependent oxidoreductase n=1 Tax=Nocardioides sambongensis TaxID=2589074 RepID=UPI001E61910C|nr:molybdopterin-dependent oxidoreductase [Nocardioides sambongensis]
MSPASLHPPREADFSSRLRSAAVAARVGMWLGVCFAVAFLTGLVSHYAQLDRPPVPFPTDPSWGYRVNQALHVLAGTAAVPLLLVKLWTVYPLLFARMPRPGRALVRVVLERGSIAVLVGAALFQISTGLANVTQWYPWSFSFRGSHYAIAWVAIGALLVHIGIKLPLIREVLGRDVDASDADRPAAVAPGMVSRRGLLRTTWLAAAVAAVASAGGTLPVLDRFAVLAARRSGGPGGVPVNRTAESAGVEEAATATDWTCEIRYGDRSVRLGRADLERMSQHTVDLPIACVEGWSASATWTGVRVRDLVALVGAPAAAEVAVSSLQRSGGSRSSVLPPNFTADERTLLALTLNGSTLSLDHGYPARVIAPNRPGVLQTKWVDRLEVTG